MIESPPGWTQRRAGDVLMMWPRSGEIYAVMTYAERVSPIRTLPALLYEVLGADADFERTETLQIFRFITDEHEYAARIACRGTHRGRAIAHVVSAIYTESFCTRLHVRGESARLGELDEMVIDMTRKDRLGLGAARRRRVVFHPATDWHPMPGLALEMVLLPPDYPHTHAAITVYPAEPLRSDLNPRLEANQHDERVGLPPGRESMEKIRTGKGLVGEEWKLERDLPDGSGKMLRRLAVLQDSQYLYLAKLEALAGPDFEGLHQAFVDVIGSIEPLPTPDNLDARREAFEMWV